jgi:hypothetical protein
MIWSEAHTFRDGDSPPAEDMVGAAMARRGGERRSGGDATRADQTGPMR